MAAVALRLRAVPLAAWERDGVRSALIKAGLPADDVDEPGRLFWRFERQDDMPVGFGGLEVHGEHALLRSVVILPPLRRRGIGTTIVGALEQEARLRDCRTIYLMTLEPDFFERLGYAPCAVGDVPKAVRASKQFGLARPEGVVVMVKRLQ